MVDIHWALHFLFKDDTPLDNINLIIIRDDIEIPVLGWTWQLILAVFKLYYEAFDRPGRGLHKLIDLVALLEPSHHKIDWDEFQATIHRYDLEAAAFYTIAATQRLCQSSSVPTDLVDRWRIPSTTHAAQRKEVADFGDFIPMLLGCRIPSAFPASTVGLQNGESQ